MAIVRYRFRAYPTPQQAQMLARTFGCARIVYNDCLRLRRDAHAAGEKLSDTEVQRRVVTEAKQTSEREWLGEVASVALVQACRDARRAYRNWFDSLSPSSRLCSQCGHDDGSKPLAVRLWTCPRCGTEHDRDLNAARNVLAEGRRMAAGLADINACGAGVRLGLAPAVGDEAGTRLARLA